MNTIILNAMFAGKNGDKNIDGEVINFYLDDNGHQNYFLSQYGYLPKEITNDNIVSILMIYKISGTTFEVVGKFVPGPNSYVANKYQDKSKNIQLENFINENKITYYNVSLNRINPVNEKIQDRKFSNITFRGGKVYFPNEKIIITSEEKDIIVDMYNVEVKNVLKINQNEKWGSTNYRIFSYDEKNYTYHKNKDHKNDQYKVYDVLSEIVNCSEIWHENTNKLELDFSSLQRYRNVDYLGLNHIINGSHIELLSSNWLAHYFQAYPELFASFFDIEQDTFISVEREKNNIDIIIEFQNNVIVIENKIKANIEKTDDASCQLTKYYNIVERDYAKNRKYIVLCPDYRFNTIQNQINEIKRTCPKCKDSLNKYKIKTYNELKAIFAKNSELSNAKYYEEILDFLDDNSNSSEHYKRKKLSEKRLKHIVAVNI